MSSGIDEKCGFAHCVNIEALGEPEPIEIIPGYTLAKATPQQAQRLHESFLSVRPSVPLETGSWEMRRLSKGEMRGPLSSDEWRYFGINFYPTPECLERLELLGQAANLLGTDTFDFGVTLWTGIFYDPLFLAHFRPSLEAPPPVTIADVEPLREVYERLAAHDHGVFDLKVPLAELRDLKRMRADSKLRFLGYFAVLEAALTHAPKPSDPYDSITRQVKTKMALVANRTEFVPQYAVHFGNLTPENAWTKMYAYRSAIAHGVLCTITGELSALKSHENALAFLVKATTCVLRMALTDGRLLRDLREC